MTLLIFDCDGVLVDSEILHSEVERQIGKEFFGIDRDVQSHHKLFTGGGLAPVYRSWQAESGRTIPEDISSVMAERKNEAFAAHLQPISRIAPTLEALKDLPKCVASGTPLPTLTLALQTSSLLTHFGEHLFTAEMVAEGKPAPDLFLFAAEKMGFPPKDCIVIEDSVHGVNAALAAQMKVIGFTGGSHCGPTHAEKLSKANSVIADMADLPKIIYELQE